MKRLKWKLGWVFLEIVLILMQDRCMVCMDIPYAWKSIWMHPMELLDDVCHMESRFGLFRRSVSIGARYVHGLCLMHQSLRNHFGSTCRYFVKRLNWKLGLICLEIVLILMRDRCMICKEHTICLEINLDAPNGTPRWRVSYEILLRSVWIQC